MQISTNTAKNGTAPQAAARSGSAGDAGNGRAGNNPYQTDKLAYHPELVRRLRSGSNQTLTEIHLMPQNLCNQSCNFCSYRLPNNKNALQFDESKSIPADHLERLVRDMKDLGVRAVEVTGGGEPLAYKHKQRMFELLFDAGFDVALVTNGTLLDDALARLLARKLTWLRVSIDSATAETYCRMRKAPRGHFDAAVNAVRNIRAAGNHLDEFRLGVGFVLSNGNEHEVYDACRLAKDIGADNIRLSMTFSDEHMDFFRDGARVDEAIRQSRRAEEELTSDSFQVVNLMPERHGNIVRHGNPYHYCYTKDILCVVEGEGNVYTCCTFTGSSKGLIGNITAHPGGLKGVWTDSRNFRKALDPRAYCTESCLYAKRNMEMIRIVEGENTSAGAAGDLSSGVASAPGAPPIHVNFI